MENETFGYRIQLGAASNRNQLMDLKIRFLKLFPDMPNYLEYQPPQFKFRVGDFRSRTEAEIVLEEIRKHFPNAFITMGKIRTSRIEW
ncbi:MAG: SPOR domain-containing protein [Chitinophagales bacterium]|nr:SPOR domain-containing protein [Chitinophagales bacterium]MDW8426928.1 SPOR domain-containing protein [Chitinophagales bacterium]